VFVVQRTCGHPHRCHVSTSALTWPWTLCVTGISISNVILKLFFQFVLRKTKFVYYHRQRGCVINCVHLFICLSVGWFVSRIVQKVTIRFDWNFQRRCSYYCCRYLIIINNYLVVFLMTCLQVYVEEERGAVGPDAAEVPATSWPRRIVYHQEPIRRWRRLLSVLCKESFWHGRHRQVVAEEGR